MWLGIPGMNGPTSSEYSTSQAHEVVSIFDIPVRVRKDLAGNVKRACLALREWMSRSRTKGDYLCAVVPRVDVYTMLVWE